MYMSVLKKRVLWQNYSSLLFIIISDVKNSKNSQKVNDLYILVSFKSMFFIISYIYFKIFSYFFYFFMP